ncbi:MAG: OmpA family protein [Croceivirga sp.]
MVLNGGFEQLTECPKDVSSLDEHAVHLSSPTSGTTDIFNTCAMGKVSIPRNFRGQQPTFLGESYAGLYLYSPNDYREYILLKLDTVLQKDTFYELTMYVSLAESSTVSTNDINVLFSDRPIALGTSKNLSKSRLSRLNEHRFQFQRLEWRGSSRDMDNWTPITLRFQAKGFETHIILGNFSGDGLTNRFKTKNFRSAHKEFAYYYIDEVRLIASSQQPFEVGEPYVIEGVRFANDSYLLSDIAKGKIQALYNHLRAFPNKKITINGHTDDKGSEERNQFLSHRRAKAVASYLVELGFPDKNIVWKGHGNRKPLVTKTTEEARLKNRRVDFVITEFEGH